MRLKRLVCLILWLLAVPAVHDAWASRGWWVARPRPLQWMSSEVHSTGQVVLGLQGHRLVETVNGRAWREVASPGDADIHAVATSGSRVYVATTTGVYTRLRGDTWLRLEGRDLPSAATIEHLTAQDGGRLLALVQQPTSEAPAPPTVWRSDTDGATWSRVAITLDEPPIGLLASSEPGVAFLWTRRGFYRSGDGGATWMRLGIPTGVEHVELVHVHAANPNVVLAVQSSGSTWRSEDSGRTWTGPLFMESAYLGYRARQIVSSADPAAPMLALLAHTGESGALYVSRDRGATWSRLADQPPTVGLLALVSNGSGPSAVLAIGDRDSLAPFPALTPWEPLPEAPAGLAERLVPAAGRVLLGSRWFSMDRGRSWGRWGDGGPPPASTLLVDPRETSHVFAYSSIGREMALSTDGGRSWVPAGQGLPAGALGVVAFDPHTPHGLLAVASQVTYRSVDDGRHWLALGGESLNTFPNAIVPDPFVPGTWYTAGSRPRKTSDGGRTWIDLFRDHALDTIAVDRDHPGVLYGARSAIATPSSRVPADVVVSEDGGTTWQAVVEGLPPLDTLSVRDIEVSGSRVLLVTNTVLELGADRRWRPVADLPSVTTISDIAFDAHDRNRMYVVASEGVFVEALAGEEHIDTDGDGLPDVWETLYGLDPFDALDGTLDADADGVSTRDEFQSLADFTHPMGHHRSLFAEGAVGNGFSTRFALSNGSALPATLVARFLLDSGRVVKRAFSLQPRSRVTVDAAFVPELAGHAFGSEFTSNRAVVVERTVEWGGDGRYAHAEAAAPNPSRTWYFAEGATHSGLSVFYLLTNPGDEVADIDVMFLTTPAPGGEVATRRYRVAPHARHTLWLDAESRQPGAHWLANRDLGARITSTVPVVAERVVYLTDTDGRLRGGTAVVGAIAPSRSWVLADVQTGPVFDTFVLLANPGDVDAVATVSFQGPNGVSASRAYVVPALGRATVWVNREEFGGQRLFADGSLVVSVAASQEIVVERAQWWGDGSPRGTWAEGHAILAAPRGAHVWRIADVETGGPRSMDTMVTVLNVSDRMTTVAWRRHAGDSSSRSATAFGRFTLAPHERTVIRFRTLAAEHVGQRSSVDLESIEGAIVVERTTYWRSDGAPSPAGVGTTAVAVR